MNETLTRSPDEAGRYGTLTGAPIRCLIVDDNEIYAEAAADTLTREGIVVTGITSTSAEALRHVDALAPDVALVDIALGEENGFDLARLLTAMPCRTTVILMSAHLAEEFAEATKHDPAISYLHKSAISSTAIRVIQRRHHAACGC